MSGSEHAGLLQCDTSLSVPNRSAGDADFNAARLTRRASAESVTDLRNELEASLLCRRDGEPMAPSLSHVVPPGQAGGRLLLAGISPIRGPRLADWRPGGRSNECSLLPAGFADARVKRNGCHRSGLG